MTKAKLILIVAFVVTLAAGVALGFTLRSLTHHRARPSAVAPSDPAAPPPHSHFPDLNLTAEQKTKMDEIWNAVMRNSRKLQEEQRQEFQKQREEAVRAILTAEQQVQYDAVLKDYAHKMEELRKAREKLFQEAVEKTKPILDEAQRKKYEEWLKSLREDRHPGGVPPPAKAEEHTAAGSGT